MRLTGEEAFVLSYLLKDSAYGFCSAHELPDSFAECLIGWTRCSEEMTGEDLLTVLSLCCRSSEDCRALCSVAKEKHLV